MAGKRTGEQVLRRMLFLVMIIITVTYGSLILETPIAVAEDTAIPLSLDESKNVTLSAGETAIFSFTPDETAVYKFSSAGDCDTVGALFDSDMAILASDDESGDSSNFSITYELSAGVRYYFGARMYFAQSEGSFTVTLKQVPIMISEGFSYLLLEDGTAGIVGCSLRGDIVIPDTLDGYAVTNLASKLFYGMGGITSVTIPASVTCFGNDPTNNDWDYVFSYCYELERITVDAGNPTFRSIDGVLYSKDGNTLINYPCNRAGQVYHAEARTLCCTSFASCRNLRFLFLDNADTTWYTYTFYNTSGVTAFYREGGRTQQKISADTTSSCTFVSVREIAELPAQLELVETEAFRNTGIRYLRIPDDCGTIRAGAFTGSGLEYVSVGSTAVLEDGAFDSSVVVERR